MRAVADRNWRKLTEVCKKYAENWPIEANIGDILFLMEIIFFFLKLASRRRIP